MATRRSIAGGRVFQRMRRTTIINRMEDKWYPIMCSPEHEIELIIIAELLYMNMRGTSRVGGGAENE